MVIDFSTFPEGESTMQVYFAECFDGWNPPARRKSSSTYSAVETSGVLRPYWKRKWLTLPWNKTGKQLIISTNLNRCLIHLVWDDCHGRIDIGISFSTSQSGREDGIRIVIFLNENCSDIGRVYNQCNGISISFKFYRFVVFIEKKPTDIKVEWTGEVRIRNW